MSQPFVYEAKHGGDISTQEGGYALCGITGKTGETRRVPIGIEMDITQDILDLARIHFDNSHPESVNLPPFRLTIELLPTEET